MNTPIPILRLLDRGEDHVVALKNAKNANYHLEHEGLDNLSDDDTKSLKVMSQEKDDPSDQP